MQPEDPQQPGQVEQGHAAGCDCCTVCDQIARAEAKGLPLITEEVAHKAVHPGGLKDWRCLPPAPPDPGAPAPRLRKPAAFRAAKERIRQRNEWLALPEDERARRLAALADHEADVRYTRARARLLGLLDDGRLADALADAVKWAGSRRTRADLKRRARKDDKDGRHARWLLVQLARTAAEVQAAAQPPVPEDPDADAGPPVRITTGDQRPGPGAVRVKTKWAKPGDLV